MSGVAGTRRTRLTVAYGVLVASAAFFLGDHLLCADEAETALLARSITRHGLPVASDGFFEISVDRGRDWNEDGIYVWSPWLDEYLAALSFLVLGPSTVTARLPFALLSLLTVALFARLAWSAFRSHEVALSATFLLVTNVPFLLHGRQCRYYAVVLFAQVVLMGGFLRLVRGRRWAGVLTVGAALTVQFYCNYSVVPGNLLALAAAGLIAAYRRGTPLWALPAAVAIMGVLAVPWLAYSSTGQQVGALELAGVPEALAFYLARLHFHVMPFLVLAIPFAVEPLRKLVSAVRGAVADAVDDGRLELCLFIGATVLAQLAVLSIAPKTYFRYVTPLIPGLLLVGAAILARYVQIAWGRRLCVALLGLTNVLSVGSAFGLGHEHEPELPIATFTASLLADYEDRVEAMAEFLEGEGAAGESFYAPTPEFALVFETGVRGIDGRWHKLDVLDGPDWIAPRSPSDGDTRPRLVLPERLLRQYEAREITVPRSRSDVRRPDPHARAFFTPRASEEIILYERRKTD